jgi:hypothetical protein
MYFFGAAETETGLVAGDDEEDDVPSTLFLTSRKAKTPTALFCCESMDSDLSILGINDGLE